MGIIVPFFRRLRDVNWDAISDGQFVKRDGNLLVGDSPSSGASALVDLTDVTGTPGTGKAPVSDGAGGFPLTDVSTQAELDAEAASRLSGDVAAAASVTAEAATRAAADTAEAAARASADTAEAASRATADTAEATARATADTTEATARAAADALLTPKTRTITAGSGLSGGGDLSADRTLDVNVDGSTLEVNTDTVRVKADGITANEIAADAVGASEIAANAVGSAELADAAVDTAAIQDGAVTSAKIADGTIAVADLAFDPATQAELDAHVNDTSAAHAASAISYAGSAGISATDVEAALDELDTEKASTSSLLTPDGTTLEQSGSTIRVKDAGVTSAKLGIGAPVNDDVIQRKAGSWTNRTIAQLLADLAAAGTTFQPLDADLTAIAALVTTAFGRSVLTQADASALRTLAGLVIGTDVEAHDADLTTIAGLAPTNDDLLQRKAGAWTNRTMAQLIADLAALGTTFQPLDSDLTAIAALATTAYGRAFLALADAAAGRTALGLGTAAVAATGDFDAAGAAAAAQAASQPLDSDLTAFAGLAIAADKLPYGNGSHTMALADFTAAGRALLDDADAAAQLTTLGLSAFIKTLVDDADAATARATLGLVIGTNVQAFDADLTTYAGITPSANVQSLLAAADYAAMRVLLGLVIGTNVAAAGISDRNGQAGVLIPTARGWQGATNTFTANRVNMTRFVLSKDFTVTGVKWRSVTGGTGNVDVGIYDSTLANKLASSGSTSGKKGAATTQTLNFSGTVALTAGTVYYFALESDTSDGSYGAANYASALHEQLFGNTAGVAESLIKDAGAFPLPSSLATPAAASSTAPVVVLI